MAQLQTYLTQVQRLVHDASQATFSTSELTDYINEAREDIAMDTHCVRHLTTGVQLIPGQEIYSIDGAVAGAIVGPGGSGYTAATIVTFDPAPAGGVTATGVPVITAGTLSSITMTQWGDNYTSVPNIAISDTGGGTGATATAVTFLNAFQVLSIANIWNTQRYLLSFRGFTLFQAYMRGWSSGAYQSRPSIWTLHPQDLNVYLQPPPDQLYLSEWDMISLPLPLVNATDNDAQVLPPWNKALQFRAAAIGLMKHQNFEQAEYYDKKYEQRVRQYITTAAGIRIPNPYNSSFQRKVMRG
jgi:hypothetical protein